MTFPELMITALLLAAVAWYWRPLGRLLHRAKQHLIGYNERADHYERQLRARVAREIAEQIMLTVIGPGAYCEDRCPDWVRYRQALADADLARGIGSGKRPTRIQAGEPGCSPSVRNRRPAS